MKVHLSDRKGVLTHRSLSLFHPNSWFSKCTSNTPGDANSPGTPLQNLLGQAKPPALHAGRRLVLQHLQRRTERPCRQMSIAPWTGKTYALFLEEQSHKLTVATEEELPWLMSLILGGFNPSYLDLAMGCHC